MKGNMGGCSEQSPAAGARRILVIGDDVTLADSLRNRLSSKRFDVVAVEDGVRGLKEAQREDVALVITHAVLPKLDGFALCRMLKYDERFVNRPIIMLSSLAQEKFERLSSVVGADAFFRKPVDVARLAASARELLSDVHHLLPEVILLPASLRDEVTVEEEPMAEQAPTFRAATPIDGEESSKRQRRVTFL